MSFGGSLATRLAMSDDANDCIPTPDISRRRDCHFIDIPSPIRIETPSKGRGGVQQNDSLADG